MVNGAHRDLHTIADPYSIGCWSVDHVNNGKGFIKGVDRFGWGDWQIDEIDERIQWIYQKKARDLMNTYTYL
jgi:hypothetical protein